MSNKDLVVQNHPVTVTSSEPFTLETQKDLLQTLIDSGKIPIKSLPEAFAVAQYGRDLGFSPIISFNFIISIQGRLSLSVQAIKALLLRGGVTWKTIYDGYYLYSDGSVEEFKIDKGDIKAVDKISKIEFHRNVNGFQMVEYGTFTYREAQQAGLVKAGSAWEKYTRQLLTARAFTNGADKIASDLKLGLYSADEVVGMEHVDESRIIRNSDGEVEKILDAEVVTQ